MRYVVQFAPPAARHIADLTGAVKKRVVARIESLGNDPRPHGCKKLAGSEYWRIRVGDYRVVYSIDDKELLVLVIRVAHRREVYR